MVFIVKCLICSEILKYERDNTATLCEHIRRKHPKHRPLVETTKQKIEERYLKDIKKNTECFSKIINKSCGMEQQESFHSENEFKTTNERLVKISDPNLHKTKMEKKHKKDKTYNSKKVVANAKLLYKREYKPKTELRPSLPKRQNMYKTTVEKWRPGGDKITCPECGCTKRPIIRSHTDKITNSSFGAAMVLSCWPFCFLPWIFPVPTHEHLHCSLCNHYLGVYNHKNEKVTPNYSGGSTDQDFPPGSTGGKLPCEESLACEKPGSSSGS